MYTEYYLEYDESSVPPVLQYVWKVDGLSRRPGGDSLYVRYWDASSPRPRDANSFEYTLLSKFLECCYFFFHAKKSRIDEDLFDQCI